VRAAVAEATDGRIQFELRATGVKAPPDSDTGLIAQGYASLTTICAVAEAWPAETSAGGSVQSHVVPGTAVEPVHTVPDASAPRSLHRPLHAGAVPAES
jgi:hypothetical protein